MDRQTVLDKYQEFLLDSRARGIHRAEEDRARQEATLTHLADTSHDDEVYLARRDYIRLHFEEQHEITELRFSEDMNAIQQFVRSAFGIQLDDSMLTNPLLMSTDQGSLDYSSQSRHISSYNGLSSTREQTHGVFPSQDPQSNGYLPVGHGVVLSQDAHSNSDSPSGRESIHDFGIQYSNGVSTLATGLSAPDMTPTLAAAPLSAHLVDQAATLTMLVDALAAVDEYPKRSGAFYTLKCPGCNQAWRSLPGLFTHLSRNQAECKDVLSDEKSWGEALRVGGTRITDATKEWADAHNSARKAAIGVSVLQRYEFTMLT